MKVFIISTNSLPAAPSGPAYLAGAVREAGHRVEVFEALFAVDLESELRTKLLETQPDVVAVSIRLVFGDVQDPAEPGGTRHMDLRPRIRQIVDLVRQSSQARIVLGGPGFNYYAKDWLEYLGVDEGIRGEGEVSFPLYLDRLLSGGCLDNVPGRIARQENGFVAVPPQPVETWEGTGLPAYDCFDLPRYTGLGIQPALFTKRGCAFSCSYCPYAKLEGKRYRLKTPERVLDEIRWVLRDTPNRRVTFSDNNFNAPIRHAKNLCRAFIRSGLDFQWSTGDLRPIGVTDELCRLMEDSGCYSANLAIESASESMLKRMKRGYSPRQVRASLETLSRSRIPFGASLMLGAPGETPETIAETLAVLDDYPIPGGVWVTVGVYLWTDYQDIVADARETGFLKDPGQLFSGAVYLSPGLSGPYLDKLCRELRARSGASNRYTVQVNKPEAEWTFERLPVTG